jgi:Stress responsive A/B Barrel Domain
MIRHTVVFKLKHDKGSPAESDFLKSIWKLADIPTVKNFECLRQISKNNTYDFGVSMEFSDEKDYQVYNNHPGHVLFVKSRWIPEVADFMEIDYELLC